MTIQASSRMLIALLLAYGKLDAQPQTQKLVGRVVNDAGGRLDRIPIRVTRLPEYGRDGFGRIRITSPPVNTQVLTGANGGFEFNDLPVGKYHVCAAPSQDGQIGNCEWGKASPTFELTGRGPVDVGPLRLERGRTITVRLSDPRRRLSSPSKVLIGVMSAKGYYSRARMETPPMSEGVRVFRLTVPSEVDVKLFVDSDFGMSDSLGVAVEQRRPGLPLRAAADRSAGESVLDLRVD